MIRCKHYRVRAWMSDGEFVDYTHYGTVTQVARIVAKAGARRATIADPSGEVVGGVEQSRHGAKYPCVWAGDPSYLVPA